MSEYRYRAFISYSHADRRWGNWLHRRLESYRVPRKLVGKETAEGPVPTRLSPIFRDRDDLPAGADLTGEVQSALRESRFLVVICSPNSARSKWVNQEIMHFKRLHGEGRILAAIIDGEPFAKDQPDENLQECFPKALRYRLDSQGELSEQRTEPIAADFRPGGDGRRYGRSKIAAGLLGLKLDDLIRRETQRRNARMTALASGSLAIAAAMGLLAYATLLARNEAQRQRTEAVRARSDAEGLIEFMLTDLREKLDAVGRLDALEVVGQRALQYYGARDIERTEADALGRRARTQMLIGEVDNLRGDLDAALLAYREAAATTEEQLERDPQNTQRIFDHSQSVFWVGYIAWQRGDLVEAARQMNAYRELAAQLVRLEPDQPEWQVELGYAVASLGTLAFEQRRWSEALERFEQSRAINEAHVARDPQDAQAKLNLGQDFSSIGEILAVSGRYDEAIASFEREIALYDRLTAEAEHELAASRREWAEIFLARIALDLGRLDAARQKLAPLAAALQARANLRAGDTRLREAQAVVLTEWSQVEAGLGEEARARELAQAAGEAALELAGKDLDNLLWQSYYGHALATAARLSPPDEAGLAAVEAQRERLLHLAQRSPQTTFIALAAADMERMAGDFAAGETATRHWREALRLLPSEATQRTPDEHCLALTLQYRLGQTQEARQTAEGLQAIGYRHPACAAEQRKAGSES